MGQQQNDQDGLPSPQLVMATAVTVREVISIAQLTMWTGQRPVGTVRAHPTEPRCALISELGAAILFVEVDDNLIGIGIQPADAPIFEYFPMVCVCIKNHEMFFVSRAITLNGIEIPAFAIGVGPVIFSDEAKRFTRQSSVIFYEVSLQQDPELDMLSADIELPLLGNAEIPVIRVNADTQVMDAWDKLRQAMHGSAAKCDCHREHCERG